MPSVHILIERIEEQVFHIITRSSVENEAEITFVRVKKIGRAIQLGFYVLLYWWARPTFCLYIPEQLMTVLEVGVIFIIGSRVLVTQIMILLQQWIDHKVRTRNLTRLTDQFLPYRK